MGYKKLLGWSKSGTANGLIFFILAIFVQAVIIFLYFSNIKISEDILIITGLILEIISLIIIISIFSSDSLFRGFFIGSIFSSIVALIFYLPILFGLWGATGTDGAVIVPIIYFSGGIIACLIITGIIGRYNNKETKKQQ